MLWSKNESSGITPAVTKVAVGATELVPLYEVANFTDLFGFGEGVRRNYSLRRWGERSGRAAHFTYQSPLVSSLGLRGRGE